MSENKVRDRREYKKQYYESHKEHLKEVFHAYWERNKEAISERRNAQHHCDICGGRYTLRNKSRHEHSNMHLRALLVALETQT